MMHISARKMILASGAAAAMIAGPAIALAAAGHATPNVTGAVTLCVSTRSRMVTQPVAGRRCPAGTFSETVNKQGPSGVVSSVSTSLQNPATPLKVTTGGSFTANSVQVGTVHLGAGTYLVTFSAKATPNDATLATGAQIFPQFFIYDQAKNSAFTGDLFNVGEGPLEPAATTHDSYYSGVSQITVPAAGQTLHVYAFGYDSDSGAASYDLDSAVITATHLQTAG